MRRKRKERKRGERKRREKAEAFMGEGTRYSPPLKESRRLRRKYRI